MLRSLFAVGLCLHFSTAVSAVFAIDVLVRRDSEEREGGTISAMTSTEVTITTQGAGDVTVPVNEIELIEWDSAPAAMRLARAALDAGQIATAREQITETLTALGGAGNEGLQGDAVFLEARVAMEEALTDAARAPKAIEGLQKFTTTYPNHYRLFDAQLALGNLAIAAGDYATATSAFTALSRAPWKDFQMAAQIGNGQSQLAQGNAAAAQSEFDAVVAQPATTPSESARRLQAMLGQAECLQLQQKFDEAITILGSVIEEATQADTRVQAKAYLLQGNTFVAMGANPKDAIMSYLHVDVIPALSRESDLHAEALFHLSQLWLQASQPDRAREAAEALKAEYADSTWAQKL